MRKRTSLQHPRIPLGCDQQGRYPEAADEPPPYELPDLWLIISLVLMVLIILLSV